MGWFNKNQNENNKDNVASRPPVAPGSMPPPPGAPRPMNGPTPTFGAPSVVKPPMSAPGSMPPPLGAPRPMNGPTPTFGAPSSINNSSPSFGPTQPFSPPSFNPTPSNNSFSNQFNRPKFDMNNNSNYTDSQVEEILAKDILKNRVSSKSFNSNSSQDDIKQYMNSLASRRQELLAYEEVLKQRKIEIEEIMAKKGIKCKSRASSSNTKSTKVKSKKSKKTKKIDIDSKKQKETEIAVVNNIKTHNNKKKKTKKTSTKSNMVVEPTQTTTKPKSTKLKVMKHKKTVSTDHLGKVHKAKKQSSIVTRKK